MSGIGDEKYAREFPGTSEEEFLETLRREAGLPEGISQKELKMELMQNFIWNGERLVRTAGETKTRVAAR